MTHQAEPFGDNWAYLRAELVWLDRLLSVAIARQRKETKSVDRFARDRGDRATSHWWKGLVNLEGEPSYDSPAPTSQRKATGTSYQQQIEARIQTSQAQGIALALPLLCDRLQLSRFEKNLVLLTLAPEISRRYGKIYHYLQHEALSAIDAQKIDLRKIDLPTVDLLLRLLCRDDQEWRSARQCLSLDSHLRQHQLLEVLDDQVQPFLTRVVKLADPLVNYLLAEQPTLAVLTNLLNFEQALRAQRDRAKSVQFTLWTPKIPTEPSPETSVWADLVLPDGLLAALQHLCHRVQFADQVHGAEFQSSWLSPAPQPGTIALLAGKSGTGKTTAARAIAQTLQVPLYFVDLALLHPDDHRQLLPAIQTQSPVVLLLRSAQIWFGRSSPLQAAELHQFLAQRQQAVGVTLFSVARSQSIKRQWQFQRLEFPLPNSAARQRLWQQAFPPQMMLDATIDWHWLAQEFLLTGGEIRTIAHEAMIYAVAEAANAPLKLHHFLQAVELSQNRTKKVGRSTATS